MTFVSDIDAGDKYFVPTASVHQRRAIERVGPSRYEASISQAHVEVASTSRSYIEAVVNDQPRGEVLDVTKASVPRMPADLTLLTSYSIHVAAFIWQHQVILLRLKICTY